MEVERYISVFDKNDDILYRKNIDAIPLPELKKIFPPYDDDPDFIMVYQIDIEKAQDLSKLFDFKFDFDNFQYELNTYRKDPRSTQVPV